jgi:hypothetical protein
MTEHSHRWTKVITADGRVVYVCTVKGCDAEKPAS